MGVMMAPDHRFFQTHTKVLYIANKIIVDPVNIPTSCSCIFLLTVKFNMKYNYFSSDMVEDVW